MPKNWLRIFRIILVLLIALGVYRMWSRIFLAQPFEAAFENRMTIDSQLYIDLAHQMNAVGAPLFPGYHTRNVGMQILTSVWLKFFGHAGIFLFKIYNGFLWMMILLLFGFAVQFAFRSVLWTLSGVALLAHSNLLGAYTAIVQPEITLAFLVTWLWVLNLGPATTRKSFYGGFMLATICAFRPNFLLLGPLLIFLNYRHSGSGKAAWATGWGFLALAIPWNALQTWSTNGIVYFFYPLLNERLQFRAYLHPGALGFNIPRPAVTEPSGLRFVISRPLKYTKLVAERMAYLFGLREDWWTQDAPGVLLMASWWGATLGRYARAVEAVGEIFFWVGGMKKSLDKESTRRAGLVGAGLVFCTVAAHFVLGSSTRFLVPVLPVLFFFQLWGLRRVWFWAASQRDRFRPASALSRSAFAMRRSGV